MIRERDMGMREKERAGNGAGDSSSGGISGNEGGGMEMAEMGGVRKNGRRRRR